MKRIAIATLVATFALPAAAEPETFTIDPNHTFPSFEFNHFGMTTQRGRFNKTAGKIAMDAAARTGSVEVVIDAATIDTGHPKLGEHLRSPDFFDVAKFPTITFKGTGFTFEGEKVKSVAGELTMLGIAKPVTLNAAAFNCGAHPMNKKKFCGADFVATVKRSDWGLAKFVPAVSDEVTLRISVEANRD